MYITSNYIKTNMTQTLTSREDGASVNFSIDLLILFLIYMPSYFQVSIVAYGPLVTFLSP